MDANRYFLVMYIDSVENVFTSEEEVNKFLNEFNVINKDEKNPRVLGNLRTVHASPTSNWIVKYTIYGKISKKAPLEKIDKIITDNYEDEKQLKTFYKHDVAGRRGKMYIGYMYKGMLRTIPIFYKKDKVYTDYELLRDLMVKNATNEVFLSNVWSDKKLNSPEYRKNIEFYLENLQTAYGKYITSFEGVKVVEDAINDFMRAWCSKGGVINQRRVREIGSIIKNNLESRVNNNKKEVPKINTLEPANLETEKELRLF